MTELNPPSLPEGNKKDTITFNKKNLSLAFSIVSLVILVIILIAGSESSDDSSSTKDTVAQQPAPIETNPPAPATNKYDDYMDYVLNNSGQANTWSKADVIEFGDLVCQALDNGNSIRSVVSLLNGYAKTGSDVEFFASVMIASINHLCPEYKSDLNYYLNS